MSKEANVKPRFHRRSRFLLYLGSSFTKPSFFYLNRVKFTGIQGLDTPDTHNLLDVRNISFRGCVVTVSSSSTP